MMANAKTLVLDAKERNEDYIVNVILFHSCEQEKIVVFLASSAHSEQYFYYLISLFLEFCGTKFCHLEQCVFKQMSAN